MAIDDKPVNENASEAIIRAWALLPRLQALSFVAEPGPGSSTGWRGRGQAQVCADADGADWRLIERGRFQPAGAARSVPFENVYRWQRRGAALALSHERFGTAAAVFLFDLVADGPNRLTSRRAHYCGDDIYEGRLTLAEHGFCLDWRIRGPAKDERLCYRYGIDPEPVPT